MPAAAKRANNRMDTVLDAAAELFATKGFRETSTRDIAALARIQPGSLYYHFPNKDAVLLEVYREGVARLTDRVLAEARPFSDPWTRLEAALRAHLETLLEQTHYARVLLRVIPDSAPEIASQLVALRDMYENQLRNFFSDLPLPAHVDPSLMRLLILGAANHAQVWHKPDGRKPADIAAQLVQMVRATAEAPVPMEKLQ
ncbi:MAG: TetR/AcrR family transcriptional regulator [Pseudomonadota bacterium]